MRIEISNLEDNTVSFQNGILSFRGDQEAKKPTIKGSRKRHQISNSIGTREGLIKAGIMKMNQDNFVGLENFMDIYFENAHLFGVFDGHGQAGWRSSKIV